MSKAPRAVLEMRVMESWIKPDERSGMTDEDRVFMRQQFSPKLRKFSNEDLERYLSPAPGSPRLLLDNNGNIIPIAQGAQQVSSSDGIDPFSLRIEEANRKGWIVLANEKTTGPVMVRTKDLERHLGIIGITGGGKSTLLYNTLVQLVRSPSSMIIIDKHGSLVDNLVKRLPADRLKDIVYIDPTSTDRGWGINIMQSVRKHVDPNNPNFDQAFAQALDLLSSQLVTAFSVVNQDTAGYGIGPRVGNILKYIFLACGYHPKASAVDAWLGLSDDEVRKSILKQAMEPRIRVFFENSYEDFDATFRDPAINKMEPLVGPILANTFSRRDQCMDLADMMAQNKIVLFNLKGLDTLNARIFGSLIIHLTYQALTLRDPDDPTLLPCYLVADEFQNYASTTSGEFLAQARKWRGSMIVAFQNLEQLPKELQASVLTNTSTKILFKLSALDADTLAKDFGLMNDQGRPKTKELVLMPKYSVRISLEQRDFSGGPDGYERKTVAATILPPMPEHANSMDVLKAVKERSRRLHYKPNFESDRKSVFTDSEQNLRLVLEALYEACRVREGGAKEHILPIYAKRADTDRTWEEANDHMERGLVTKSVLRCYLQPRGSRMSYERVEEHLLTLQRLGWAGIDRTPGGTSWHLTTAGLQEIAKAATPAATKRSGGDGHREAIRGLYGALLDHTPTVIEMPTQTGDGYAPDLIVVRPGAQAGNSWWNRIGSGVAIHFQVEGSTASKLGDLGEKVANAHLNGAMPVLVFPENIHGQQTYAIANRQHTQLLASLNSSTPSLSKELHGVVRDVEGDKFHSWILTKAGKLLVVDPVSQVARPLLEAYPDARATRRPLGQTTIQPGLDAPAPQAPPPAPSWSQAPAPVARPVAPQASPAPAPRPPPPPTVPDQLNDAALLVATRLLEEADPDRGVTETAMLEAIAKAGHQATPAALEATMMSQYGFRKRDGQDGPYYRLA